MEREPTQLVDVDNEILRNRMTTTNSSKPIWMELAEEFAGYVDPDCIYKMYVFEGTVPGYGPAAILRIWHITYENVTRIKATVAITADIAWCTDVTLGVREIE